MIVQEGDWTLVSYDAKLRRQVWARQNPDGSTTHRTDYEVDPTIEINKAQRNMAQKGWAGDYHHIASVPLNIFHDQLAEASKGDDAYVSKWLNNSDNAAWRTKVGNV
jgi:hypothetical protein